MSIIHIIEEYAEPEYKEFIARIIPTIPKVEIIGVRIPQLRKLASSINYTAQAADFITQLPHSSHEENCIHVFLLNKIKDFDRCIAEIDRFLPYINNWAVCDSLRPNVFKKNIPRLYEHIARWMSSSELYTIRFGIEMLMNFSLGEYFDIAQAKSVAKVNTEEYYLSMMVAWYFATALVDHYDEIVPFIESNILDVPTHNRAIQKAVDSFRISDEKKAYLKTLRRKNA